MKRKTLSLLILLVILLLQAGFVLAAATCEEYCEDQATRTPPPGVTCICSPIPVTTIPKIIEKITDWLFDIAMVVAPLMIVIAGFMFLTSGGDPNKAKKAKDLIFWAIIGFSIILLSKAIYGIIKAILTG
ncbi:MAG: pilin [Patescibacteria group bacterium]|nr:pilin [Patescibacteria group bacterium]